MRTHWLRQRHESGVYHSLCIGCNLMREKNIGMACICAKGLTYVLVESPSLDVMNPHEHLLMWCLASCVCGVWLR